MFATNVMLFQTFTKKQMDYSLTLIRAARSRADSRKCLHRKCPNHSFLTLLEEIPHQAKPHHEIAVRIIGRCVKIISGHFGVEMLQLEEYPRLADPGVDKEIEHWEITHFGGILHKCLGCYRIVIVDVEFGEIIEGKTGLQVQCLFEKIIGEVQRIPCSDLWYVQDILLLVDFLVKYRIV